ncbi:phage tail assembly protein [Neisseria animalis]|uniref:Phage tail assembly protein n=1 Tax=Neisseria animalis TaxID=492 RepID=A0A5P3MQ50_NEIAN|nr:phage tail assembly protein [Neisseria animalis]QEY23550.1 phage tail assembly protein [Neisseria animalis]ROW32150.1 phage tail assembly protein [Neisseria animalis]VEE09198.1 phage protein [Neisseria animalis]
MTEKNESQKLQEQLGIGKEIVLVEPLDTPTGKVEKLTLRRVKVKDYKRAAEQYPDNAALQQLATLSLASGLMEEDFDNLCWEDYQQISKFCLGV